MLSEGLDDDNLEKIKFSEVFDLCHVDCETDLHYFSNAYDAAKFMDVS